MVPGATGGGRDRGPRGDEPGPRGLGGNYRLTPDPRKLSVLRTRRVTRMSA